MKNVSVNRRDFLLSTAGAGVLAFSAAGLIDTLSAEPASKNIISIFICQVCDHVEFGAPPQTCPMCRSSTDKFERNDSVFSDALARFKDVAAEHTPILIAKKKSHLVTEAPSISVLVKIGQPIHPGTPEHLIRFIDCYIDDVFVGCLLPKSGLHPAVGVEIKATGSKVRVVSLCNQHGYWQKEVKIS